MYLNSTKISTLAIISIWLILTSILKMSLVNNQLFLISLRNWPLGGNTSIKVYLLLFWLLVKNMSLKINNFDHTRIPMTDSAPWNFFDFHVVIFYAGCWSFCWKLSFVCILIWLLLFFFVTMDTNVLSRNPYWIDATE